MIDSSTPTKVCTKCREEKPFEDFNRWSGSRDGRFPWCRECNSAYQRERTAARRAARPPKEVPPVPDVKQCARCGAVKLLRDYPAKSSGKYGRDSRCRACRAEMTRLRYESDPTPFHAQNKVQYQKNVERERRRAAARRAANPDWWVNLSDDGRLTQREAASRSRIAKKYKVLVEVVDFSAILARDGYHCHICGQSIEPASIDAIEFDHVIPVERGGAHSAGNIRVAHVFCNKSKGAKLLDEIARRGA